MEDEEQDVLRDVPAVSQAVPPPSYSYSSYSYSYSYSSSYYYSSYV